MLSRVKRRNKTLGFYTRNSRAFYDSLLRLIRSQSYIFGNRFRGHLRASEEQMCQQNVGYVYEPGPGRRRAEIGKFDVRSRGPVSAELGETLLRVQNVQRSFESQWRAQ